MLVYPDTGRDSLFHTVPPPQKATSWLPHWSLGDPITWSHTRTQVPWAGGGGTPLPGRILSTLFLTNPKRQAGPRLRAGWVLTPCSSVRTRTKHLRYHVPVSLSISISSSICRGVLILFTCKEQQRAKCWVLVSEVAEFRLTICF